MDPVTLPSTDTSTFCRLCLSSINLMTVIKRDAADLAVHEPVLALLRTHLNLQLDELKDFPCAVCEVCLTVLRNFDALHHTARRYSRALRDLLQEKYCTGAPNHNTARLARVRNTPSAQIQPMLEENVLLEICDAPLPGEDEANELQRMLQHGEIVLEEYHVTDAPSDEEQVSVEPKKYVPENRGQISSRIVPVLRSSIIRQNELANGGPSRKVLHPAVVRGRIVGSSSSPTVNSNKTPSTQDLTMPKIITRTVPQPVRVVAKALTVSTVHPARDLDTDGGGLQATAKKLFRCDQCSSRFVEQKNYYNHVCKKAYKEPQLNRKERVPPVEVEMLRFRCTVCDTEYRNKLHLNKHEYEAHGKCNEDYGVKCSICDMMFSQKQDYRLHVAAMHPSDLKFTIDMSPGQTINKGEISLRKVVKKID
ncbi:uncharacterized protein LOC126569057 [Anopheles aquasalis]|uniref:uncharacterized protein LOC126569057 n=1 Tax=Anopheles aquasalis TaxID=42839 RepID=UPI00215A4C0F|nr:uncharacterized protein LOC126569057 [Anopheles aquasalis]